MIGTSTDCIWSNCLTLLDTLPEIAYIMTELFMAIIARNDKEFKEFLLTQLMVNVKNFMDDLLAVPNSGEMISNKESVESAHAVVHIRLFTLLFEDCSWRCVCLVETSAHCSKWSGLWPFTTCICSTNWKWFDVGAGKWQGYQAGNNKTIYVIFWSGEQSVKFIMGQRKYNIQFGSMIQANKETGNRGPPMIVLKQDKKEADKEVKKKGRWKKEDTEEGKKEEEGAIKPPAEVNKKFTKSMDTRDKEQDQEKGAGAIILSQELFIALLRAAVGHISIPVDLEALNTILQLCLLLMRTFSEAMLFTELDGIKLLLGLTQISCFSGFFFLASLLVRHMLTDEATLSHTMEKILGSSASASTTGTTNELHYLLRSLVPAGIPPHSPRPPGASSEWTLPRRRMITGCLSSPFPASSLPLQSPSPRCPSLQFQSWSTSWSRPTATRLPAGWSRPPSP